MQQPVPLSQKKSSAAEYVFRASFYKYESKHLWSAAEIAIGCHCSYNALFLSDESSHSAKWCLALARMTRTVTVRQAHIRAAALTNL